MSKKISYDNLSRRTLLSKSLKYGAGLSMAAAFPSAFASIVFDPEEEKAKKSAAQYVMQFGSPYKSDMAHLVPHVHQELKQNIQEMTQGKVYVEVADGGAAGVGPKLMSKVARNTVSAGLISVSNLVPVAGELDILNIPFWSAGNQNYVNLVTSSVWKSLILDKIQAEGKIAPLFHYVVGPRTATTTRAYGKVIKVPSDLEGIRFRIPSSKTLKIFYNLANAKTRKIAWGKTAEAARSNLFDACDPSINGLYGGPDNLKKELHAISRIESVHDGWIAVVSQKWMATLPVDVRQAVLDAADKTFRQQLKKVGEITASTSKKFEEQNTMIYTPTADERAAWVKECGHARPEWNASKKAILGDPSVFSKLIDATQINNGYSVG